MTSRAPLLLALILLTLPLPLYVGAYLANVAPGKAHLTCVCGGPPNRYRVVSHYIYYGPPSERIFWPLEQVDRMIRPDQWQEEIQF